MATIQLLSCEVTVTLTFSLRGHDPAPIEETFIHRNDLNHHSKHSKLIRELASAAAVTCLNPITFHGHKNTSTLSLSAATEEKDTRSRSQRDDCNCEASVTPRPWTRPLQSSQWTWSRELTQIQSETVKIYSLSNFAPHSQSERGKEGHRGTDRKVRGADTWRQSEQEWEFPLSTLR